MICTQGTFGANKQKNYDRIHQRRNCRTKSGNRNNRLQRTGYASIFHWIRMPPSRARKNANYIYTKLSVKTPMSSTGSLTSRNANYSCCSSPFQASAEIQLAWFSRTLAIRTDKCHQHGKRHSTENSQGYRAENSPTDNCGFKKTKSRPAAL